MLNFSIILPVLNAEQTVERCIHSLISQNYPKNRYEIIVVDNDSSDNTLSVLKKYSQKIRLLHEPKRGSYSARNKGIKHAKGSIMAFTDSDCIADKNWLSFLSRPFRNRNVMIVGGKISSNNLNSVLLRYFNEFGHPQQLFSNSNVPFFATANMAVRKSKGMRFNESLKSCGDLEFCSRIINKRNEIYYEPEAVVRHLYPNSLVEFAKKNFFYGLWKYSIGEKGKLNFVPLPGHRVLYKNYGASFIFLRIFHDASFNIGFYMGLIKNKISKYRNYSK